MALEDHDDESQATPREIELLNRLDALQSQVTELHKARETTENPELLKEVQSLKDQLNEHSKKLEQSAEKLGALEAENLVLRDKNQAPDKTSNKQQRFRTRVRPMPPLSTPTDENGGPRRSVPAEGEPANGDNVARRTLVHEDSDSKMKDEEEAPEGATTLIDHGFDPLSPQSAQKARLDPADLEPKSSTIYKITPDEF
ncbi:hypothetical protein F2Q69_00021743 [Brassica cretica]|uniref:Uncharacterized protein n=1 Tax=Brassica cretica TaxID=69181 RepID=A0A8S9Q6D4_BRACR|nr:hypothetical protein F2Q69_00021743 [Brassica cretica]